MSPRAWQAALRHSTLAPDGSEIVPLRRVSSHPRRVAVGGRLRRWGLLRAALPAPSMLPHVPDHSGSTAGAWRSSGRMRMLRRPSPLRGAAKAAGGAPRPDPLLHLHPHRDQPTPQSLHLRKELEEGAAAAGSDAVELEGPVPRPLPWARRHESRSDRHLTCRHGAPLLVRPCRRLSRHRRRVHPSDAERSGAATAGPPLPPP